MMMADVSPIRPGPARRGSRFAVLAVVVVVTGLASCSRERPGADATLQQVTLDLAGMDAQVASQIHAAESAAAAAGTGPGAAEAWGVLGETCHAYELLPAAETAYANARELAPDEPRWWYLGGIAARAGNHVDTAVRLLRRAGELAPAMSSPAVALAEALLAQGEIDAALDQATRAVAVDDTDMGGWLVLAEASWAAQDVQATIDAYRTILQRQPEATKIRVPLSAALRRNGLTDKADQVLLGAGDRPVLRRDPWMERVLARREGFDAEVQRASQQFELGHFRTAADGFEAALAIRPDDVPTMVNLAGSLLKLSQFDRAASLLEDAVERDPEHAGAWFDLGSAEVGRGRDEAAVTAYRHSLDLRPDSIRTGGELGDALRRLGRWQEALDQYRALLQLQTDLEPALAWGAVCLVRLERWTDARQWLKDALERQPHSTALAGLAARLLATAADPAARDGAQALGLARQLEQIAEVPIHLELVALARAETGDFAGATASVERALEALPVRPSLLHDRLERERAAFQAGRPWREFGEDDLFVRDAMRNRMRLAVSAP